MYIHTCWCECLLCRW